MRPRTLLIAAVLAIVLAPRAVAATIPQPPLAVDSHGAAPSKLSDNLSWLGADFYEVSVATPADTPVQVVSGAGVLYGVDCSSGTSGDYGVPLDKSSTSGITVNSNGQITPAVLSSANGVTTCTAQGVCGSWRSPVATGTRFSNGIVFIKHGSAGSGGNERCQLYLRLDASNAANPIAQ